MAIEREEVRNAVNTMLNDVIEQAFHYLVNQPQQTDEVNRIIKESSDEMNYQLLKVDAHNFQPDSTDLQDHFNMINKDVHRKSLELLSRLQHLQKGNTVDGGLRFD